MDLINKTTVIVLVSVVILSLFAMCPSATAAGPTENVIIVFKSPVTGEDVKYIEGLGGVIKYTYTIIDGIAASLPQSAADQLQSRQGHPANDPVASRIKYVEHDGIMYALDVPGAPVAAPDGAAPGPVTVLGA